jgi:hypothetical protein
MTSSHISFNTFCQKVDNRRTMNFLLRLFGLDPVDPKLAILRVRSSPAPYVHEPRHRLVHLDPIADTRRTVETQTDPSMCTTSISTTTVSVQTRDDEFQASADPPSPKVPLPAGGAETRLHLPSGPAPPQTTATRPIDAADDSRAPFPRGDTFALNRGKSDVTFSFAHPTQPRPVTDGEEKGHSLQENSKSDAA